MSIKINYKWLAMTEEQKKKDKELSKAKTSYDKLLIAARYGDIELAENLIHDGVNINPPIEKFVSTPLYVASINGRTEMIEYLINKGAIVDQPSHLNGHTVPLIGAIVGRSLEAFNTLISRGANIHLINSFTKKTALHEAVFLSQYRFDMAIEMIKKLFELNIDVHAIEHLGRTAFDMLKSNIETWTILSDREKANSNYSVIEKLFNDYINKKVLETTMSSIPKETVASPVTTLADFSMFSSTPPLSPKNDKDEDFILIDKGEIDSPKNTNSHCLLM